MDHLKDFIVSFCLEYARDAMRRGVLTNPNRFVYKVSHLLAAASDQKELLRLAEQLDPPDLTRSQRKELTQRGFCLLRSDQQTLRYTVPQLHRPRSRAAKKKRVNTKRGTR